MDVGTILKPTKLQLGVTKLLIVGTDQFYLLIKPEVCFIRIVYSGYGGGENQLLMFYILIPELYNYIR